jgi:hypothetical protein
VTPAPGRSIHRLGLGINTQPVVGAQGNVSSYGGQPRAESEWLTGNGDAISPVRPTAAVPRRTLATCPNRYQQYFVLRACYPDISN